MNGTRRLQLAGWCGIGGGMIWFVLTLLFDAFFPTLMPPGTPGYAVLLGIIAIALVLLLIGFLGIQWGSALGGRWGTSVFSIAVLGYVLMAAGTAMQMGGVGPLSDPPERVSLIFLLGRLVAVAFAFLTGIAVLTARRWPGWTRYVPLLVALWPLLTELVPVILIGHPLPALYNAVWGLLSALLGWATLVQMQSPHVSSSMAVAHS